MSKLSFSIYIAFFATLCNASYDTTVAKPVRRKNHTKSRKKPLKDNSMGLFKFSLIALNAIGIAGTGFYLYNKDDTSTPPHTFHTTPPNRRQRVPVVPQNNIKAPNIDNYLKGKVYLRNVIKEDDIPDDEDGEKKICYVKNEKKGNTTLAYDKDKGCYSFEAEDLGAHLFERKKGGLISVQCIPYILAKPTTTYLEELKELNEQNPSKEVAICFIKNGSASEILRPDLSTIENGSKFNSELTIRDICNLVIFKYCSQGFPYKTAYIYEIMFSPEVAQYAHIDKQLKDLPGVNRLLIKIGTNEKKPPRDCQYQFIQYKTKADENEAEEDEKDHKQDTSSSSHTFRSSKPDPRHKGALLPLNNIKTPNMDNYKKGAVYLVTLEEDDISENNGHVYYANQQKIALKYNKKYKWYCFEPKDLGRHSYYINQDKYGLLCEKRIPAIFAKPTEEYLQELEKRNKENRSRELYVRFIIDGGDFNNFVRHPLSLVENGNRFNPELTIRDIINLVTFKYCEESFKYYTTFIYRIVVPSMPMGYIPIDLQLMNLAAAIEQLVVQIGTDEENPPADCEYLFVDYKNKEDDSDEESEDDEKEEEDDSDEQKEEDE